MVVLVRVLLYIDMCVCVEGGDNCIYKVIQVFSFSRVDFKTFAIKDKRLKKE